MAAEAESGEMDDLGDPSELHDLVSTESALTEVHPCRQTYAALCCMPSAAVLSEGVYTMDLAAGK